ncbi:MAG: class I SAM-dependent methyltransferase, partial [Burkholderiaceae bacterium]
MNYDLLIDLHKGNKRQGPGGDEQTKQALALSGLSRTKPSLVADVGCGTGCSTLVLAENLNASIVAVDLFEDFLLVL